MNFKFFLTPLLFCLLFASPANGQIIAEFQFEDASNPPASLLKNSITPDDTSTYADSINPNAIGVDGGAYVKQNPATEGEENLNLQIPLKLVSEMKDFYLEWEVNWQDEDGWLLSIEGKTTNGLDFTSGIYFDKEKGFKVRYFRPAESGDTLVDSKWQIGGPINMGQKAVVGFFYDYSEGIAYLSLDGTEIWNTTMSKNEDGEFFKAAPEVPFNWNTSHNYFTVGSGVTNSAETEIPFLYNFRISTEACYVAPPEVKNDTICAGETITLTASGGNKGSYRWYASDSTEATPLENESGQVITGSSYTPPPLGKDTIFYVAIKGEECDSYKVPVQVVVNETPPKPEVAVEAVCGTSKIKLKVIKESQNGYSYNWYSDIDDTEPVITADNLEIEVPRDTTLYVQAVNGNCFSPMETVNINVSPLPSLIAGADRSTILKSESAHLLAEYNKDSVLSVQWSPAAGLDVIDSSSPWASPIKTTTYKVTGKTLSGCTISDSITIEVIQEFPVTNAFSPNKDGRNDKWEIPYLYDNYDQEKYPDCIIMVYNNWGNQVYYSEGYPKGKEWDGSFNGKELPGGTYYYTIILHNGEEPLRGSLMILR